MKVDRETEFLAGNTESLWLLPGGICSCLYLCVFTFHHFSPFDLQVSEAVSHEKQNPSWPKLANEQRSGFMAIHNNLL